MNAELKTDAVVEKIKDTRMKTAMAVARLRALIAIIAGITLAGVALAVAQPDAAVAAGRGERVARKPLVRDFPASKRVDVVMGFRWRADRRCTLVRFPANRVALLVRARRLWVRGPRRTVLVKPQRAPAGAARLHIRLDASERLIQVSLDGHRAGSVHASLIPESRVVVGSTGTCASAKLSSVAVRPGRSKPAATNGGSTNETSGGAAANRPLPATPAQPLPTSPNGGGGAHTARLFAAKSVWNAPLPADAPLDPQSNLLADALRDEAKRELAAYSGPYVATNSGVPVYTVPPDQPTVPVRLDVWDFATSLSETFAAGVPIPSDAVPASNPDQSLVVWQPSTDRMWEFFMLRRDSDGWHARWGGAMDSVSRNSGYFGADAFIGASSRWGATATSLPLAGGLMLHDEVRTFRIDHALALSVGTAKQGMWSWPAQRSDGESAQPDAIPEGARFRLDPNLDLSKLDMPPMTRAMAQAAQRYGIIVNNQTGQGLCFWTEDPTRYGINYRTDLFDGMYPTQYLRSFPWDHLQLLKMELHTPAG
jgi:hypothetical protein